jgi:phenylacetate-CoA ligase
MRKFITKHIAYPLQDFYNKTSILKTRHWLLETQSWPESKLLDYQFSKFIRLFEHASRNVPYYSDQFSAIKLKSSDIRSFDDLHKIPVLSKEIARKENNNLIARNIPKRHIHKAATGGTTGPPLKLLRDPGDLTFTWAAFYRWYDWMGIDLGDRVSKIWGARTVLSMPFYKKASTEFRNWYYNRSVVNSFNLNEQTLPGVIAHLNRFKPLIIRGYLSAFIQIAEYMRDHGLSINFKPKAVSSTTETLMEPFRQLVQQQFGATLYDQYGCGECNSIAFEAGDGNGLYITVEHVKLEILDDRGYPDNRTEGRIILTNLDNYIMPFIRYENGDSGQINDKPIMKLFNLPLLKRVSGRTADTIILSNGSKVHGVFFTDIMNELYNDNPDYIHRFQVFQKFPGEIEFRIETKKKLADDYLKSLENALSRFFIKVTIVPLEELPLDSSGKFRYILKS